MLNRLNTNHFSRCVSFANGNNSLIPKRWKSKGITALALGTLLLSGCNNGFREAVAPESPDNVVTEEVSDMTNQLIGQTVTIRSKPIRLVSPTSFTVTDQKLFSGDNILVVNATGEPFTLPDGQDIEIQATGEVRQFVLAEINRDYKLNLQSDLYSEYENQPVIIAQSMALAPQPGDIISNPTTYYGKTLAVAGEVADTKNQLSFTLNEDQLLGGEKLLVLRTDPQPSISDQESIVVTGVLRPFVVAELERDYDLTWDLNVQRQLEVEYSNQPVIVADGVYPSAVDQ
ncbi:hypothetical protein VB620_00235 [Nodularia harveyana UHCC-0300]|uniref:Uncharacterized protein n=1 Tax=Nodularia harveyana UHCC-0300 TaxID=2974287 RepID=A0ABU5U8B8_9CYAN|nr:hypothetical protein [Nodularia harveyana]MEA5579764.1 hypothetical protein [Nodularia harveyana UHCC-0300]